MQQYEYEYCTVDFWRVGIWGSHPILVQFFLIVFRYCMILIYIKPFGGTLPSNGGTAVQVPYCVYILCCTWWYCTLLVVAREP